MPVYQPLENVVGLKALAWDYVQKCFISPARPEFVWTKGGLQAGKCGKGYSHEVPDPNCMCGLHAAYELQIAMEYVHASPISPIFLMEASGNIEHHVLGWRSAEMTVRFVAVPHWVSYGESRRIMQLAAYQAADYFEIPLIEEESIILIMDLWNMNYRLKEFSDPTLIGQHMPWYKPQSIELQDIPEAQIEEMFQAVMGSF